MNAANSLLRNCILLMFASAMGMKFMEHPKNKDGNLAYKQVEIEPAKNSEFQSSPSTDSSKQKFGFLDLKASFDKLKADLKAGLHEEKLKFKAGFDEEKRKFKAGLDGEKMKFKAGFQEVQIDPSHLPNEDKFKDLHSKVESMKSILGSKFNKVTTPQHQTPPADIPFLFSSAPQPICPIKVAPIYKQAVVTHVVHSVATVRENLDFTVYTHVTETMYVTVTTTTRSTVSQEIASIQITETKIFPEMVTVTKARVVTSSMPVTFTNLQISTFWATNTLTTTKTEPMWVTVTEIQTAWVTSTESFIRTFVDWISATEVVTQPISVTTNVWMEAPQLVLETTTITQPHYMTTTDYVTNVVHTTICHED